MRRIYRIGLLMLLTLSLGCGQETDSNCVLLEVEVLHRNATDSLIVYDQKDRWAVKSCIRFDQSDKGKDSAQIARSGIHKIYLFTQGSQQELGELLISPGSKIGLRLDEESPFKTLNYTGSHAFSNNHLAFSKGLQEHLSNRVKSGISQKDLEAAISSNRQQIEDQGLEQKVQDSMRDYTLAQFDKFSEVLMAKNLKYLYKASLIDRLGNTFTFQNSQKETVSLQQFKGRYVYIDVWATWCKPCKVEYPYLKQLEEYFAEQDKLEIVSISTDKDFENWLKYLTSKSMEGTQWYSGDQSEFVSFYDIGALPRFILLDPQGKVIDPDAIRPSNPETQSSLQALVESSN